MIERDRILLFESNPEVIAAFRAALADEHGFELETTGEEAEAMRRVRWQPPLFVIVSAARFAAGDGLARRLRDRPGRPLLLGYAPPEDPLVGPAALDGGADDLIEVPLAALALRPALRFAARRARAGRRDAAERDRLQHELDHEFDRTLQLLVDLEDTASPGSADRGRRVAALALAIAQRFEVPDSLHRDLEIASRLCGLGRLVDRPEKRGTSPVGVEGSTVTNATRHILERVEAFRGAAEIIGSIHENWDGTGLPDHRLQGQIPLRSRILRATIDYLATVERGRLTPTEVVAELMEHKGGRYDPLVIVHLEALITGEGHSVRHDDFQIVPIGALEPGMVLADDLYTAGGIKLLARGTRLGPTAIESILRRHRSEPIHHGATIRRVA